MRTNLILLILLAFVLIASSGCGLFPKTDAIADQDYTFKDGTSANKGDEIYEYPNGDATANATDPDTGKPNKRVQVIDEDKAKKIVEQGETATNALPAPLSGVAKIILGILGVGGIGGIALANRKTLADKGAKPKGKT